MKQTDKIEYYLASKHKITTISVTIINTSIPTSISSAMIRIMCLPLSEIAPWLYIKKESMVTTIEKVSFNDSLDRSQHRDILQ